MKFVFYHAGPGFNSHPEESLLSPLLREKNLTMAFWNEPSTLRPDGPPFHRNDAFRHYILAAEAFLNRESAGEAVGLIGHSFGAHVLCHLVKRQPHRVAWLVFIAPGLALSSLRRRQLGVIGDDFRRHGDSRYREMERILAKYTGQFDANTEAGYRLALQNERLLGLYWHRQERMREFLPYLADPGYGVDLDSFVSVSRTMFDVDLRGCAIPAVVVFGEHDPFVYQSDELAILRSRLTHVDTRCFADSAHYPHLEQPEAFVALLMDTAMAAAAGTR